ncbi:P-loop containing nucleoside triphosphate hydrolase protein [Entophlyctis helioformis]|nr:P-loop containing nucleoside triphosphate hydrolase protein [Entophlyctis helioformis]
MSAATDKDNSRLTGLKQPSKIAVSVKAPALPVPSSTAAATAAEPASQTLGADDFKVHTTSLKRKSDDEGKASEPARKRLASKPVAATTAATSAPTARLATAPSTRSVAGRASAAAPARSAPSTLTSRTTRATAATAAKKATVASSSSSSLSSAAAAAKKPPASTAAAPVPVPAAEPVTDGRVIKKAKRPAWDLKGRVEDLEEDRASTVSKLAETQASMSVMTSQLADKDSMIQELRQSRFELESKLRDMERDKAAVDKELAAVSSERLAIVSRHEDEMRAVKRDNDAKIDSLTRDLESLRAKHDAAAKELDMAKSENAQLKSTISTQAMAAVAVESSNRALKISLEESERLASSRAAEIAKLSLEVKGLEACVAEGEAKLREEEMTRRRLHNTIQELKGNIRVFCRVRPLLGAEKEEIGEGDGGDAGSLPHITFSAKDEGAIELAQMVENASGSKTVAKTYPFQFDKVFTPSAKQGDVFAEISQLVQSALDGYNVCIFAYGQTGSGKTFTMEGYDEANAGMIPRAVEQIFEAAEALKEKGWTYRMEGQFLEIYNETIRDLLTADDGSKKHEIRHDVKGKTTVSDVCNVVVTSPKEVYKLLRKASEHRAVAATNCNERSSRSHSVFTLRLSGTNSITDESSEGLLNLIDLAGSERLSMSGSTGDRLKETQAINKSLSCLGDVIYALSNKDGHIPYRNSKLTYLLQNSLGGNSKTLMFVNISPVPSSLSETLCSLRFATKVNNCQIGTARKQTSQATHKSSTSS